MEANKMKIKMERSKTAATLPNEMKQNAFEAK